MHRRRAAYGSVAAALLLSVALAGCASTPQASRDRDNEAKRFAGSPAASIVYIYRTDTSAEDSVIWIDGRLIGATLPRTFFRVPLEPGRHQLAGMAADNGRISVETRPGEVYFISLTMLGGQSQFRLVPPETGKKVVTNCCALLENWSPGQRPLLR